MNIVIMERLVDQLLNTLDDDMHSSPVTDQIDAALRDDHYRLMLIDALFRAAARDIFAIVGCDVDIHEQTICYGMDLSEGAKQHAVEAFVFCVTAYLCGKPDTIHDALKQWEQRCVDDRDEHVFAALVGLGQSARRKELNVFVESAA